MSYLMHDEPEPNYRPFILAFIIMALAIFFALKAHADTYIGSSYNYTYSKVDSTEKPFTRRVEVVKPEPHVIVDRHVLNRSDYEKDATILIAGQRVTPKFEVSDPKPAPAELISEVVPQANPMADVTVRATISSDTEEEVNYPL